MNFCLPRNDIKQNMSVVDDDTSVLATSEADFEKEIAEYVASAEFEIDAVQAIAETATLFTN